MPPANAAARACVRSLKPSQGPLLSGAASEVSSGSPLCSAGTEGSSSALGLRGSSPCFPWSTAAVGSVWCGCAPPMMSAMPAATVASAAAPITPARTPLRIFPPGAAAVGSFLFGPDRFAVFSGFRAPRRGACDPRFLRARSVSPRRAAIAVSPIPCSAFSSAPVFGPVCSGTLFTAAVTGRSPAVGGSLTGTPGSPG